MPLKTTKTASNKTTTKEKLKPGEVLVELAMLIRETSVIIMQKGSLEELHKYAKEIKLPYSICSTCETDTPGIKTSLTHMCLICTTHKE